ncbi:MAG TPA: tRNA (cytidine(34)-2'-O)-methyltransferase [Desulfobacteraceae bacterium]|nr:tRNA (cytidine(34)-2'-O)-methyltransferase [Desulfobacteraceae bacterium]
MVGITKINHRIIQEPALNIVLYQPEIPANTGNIARLCGAARIRLHLVHPLGFRVDDKHLKRAGLDYWREVDIRHHESFEAFLNHREKTDSGLGVLSKIAAFSKNAVPDYARAEVKKGDYLLFGQETRGLPPHIRERYPCFRIPIWGRIRSLNLSTAAGIVVYHYLHQMGYF